MKNSRKGSSGSPRHTERKAASIGGAAPAPRGPRIGPGVLARVRPEYDRSAQAPGEGGAKGGPKGRAYSEE